MKRSIITFLFIFCVVVTGIAQLPQKYDSLYKTLFAKDFCKMLEQNPEIVLVDVRSPGEYSDTSSHASLNMGHLKGAVNMEIDSIKSHPEVMDKYRDKTVVLYCSHSQRSRGVSKLLSEKGFSSFYNLNGGMSSLNQLSEQEFPCKKIWVESGLGYTNLSNTDAVNLLMNEKKLVVLDVRPAAQFNSNDTLEENNIGRIKGAINIPYARLKKRIAELKKYTDAPILVYAGTGDGDAARAANELVKAGFKNVYHLLSGLNSLLASQQNLVRMENTPPFKLINPLQTIALLKRSPGILIYDTRSETEFENKDDKYWKNLGHMKNALNVREENFTKLNVFADKNAPLLLYGNPAHKLGRLLSAKGFNNIYVLPNFYDFVWSGFNVESCKEAREYVVDHDGLF